MFISKLQRKFNLQFKIHIQKLKESHGLYKSYICILPKYKSMS